MIIVAVRTVILYIVVLFAVRMMGKQELSKMSAFQMVIVFMIAELAAIPIDSTSASLVNGVMAIITLMLLQILISCLSIKCEWFKNFVNGKPSVLVDKGKLVMKELKKEQITTTDLMEQLRLAGYPSLSSVQYAIMESNGQLTVIPKADSKPLTPKDMQISVSDGVMPMIIISDGVLYKKNLLKAGLNEDILKSKMLAKNIDSYDGIFLAFYDENKSIHAFLSKDKSEVFASEVKL